MHSTREAKITSPVVSLKDGYIRTIPLGLIVGAIGLGVAVGLSTTSVGLARFYYIYLVNFCFLLSISLGCLFFVTIFHLTRAGWSVTVRRIFEYYAACVTPLFLLFLPILLPVLAGDDSLYPWVKPGYSVESLEYSKATALLPVEDRPRLEVLKMDYLSPRWFTVRMVACFLAWSLLAWFFLRTSLKQDQSGDKALTLKMQYWAPLAMIFFASSVVFGAFDLEMTLSPLWFSTMFPVYFFAGAAGGALATVVVTAAWLQRTGRVTDEITTEHYHDLGKLMFGFVVFWGYIAFSQLLLIWYANIPEETYWYRMRIGEENGWAVFSLVLLVGHLFIPFFLIMGRTARRNKMFLASTAVFLLVMHWIDHYWLVMPFFNPSSHYSHIDGAQFSQVFNLLIDIPCAIGMIGIYIAFFCLIARDRPLVPKQDPRLGESLNHVVH